MISVGENIVKAEPIAPLGAVFVEHVEKKNHFASQCRAREKTHNVEFEEDETSEEEFLYCVTSKPEMTGTVNSVSEREIYAQMLINEKPIKFHIDCSATVNRELGMCSTLASAKLTSGWPRMIFRCY